MLVQGGTTCGMQEVRVHGHNSAGLKVEARSAPLLLSVVAPGSPHMLGGRKL